MQENRFANKRSKLKLLPERVFLCGMGREIPEVVEAAFARCEYEG